MKKGKASLLFDLIKSLNKSEKRSIRMAFEVQKGDKEYSKIFDALDVLPEYDEARLLQKLRYKAIDKNALFVKQNYLYHFILKALRSQPAHRQHESELRNMMHDIEILAGKELYRHALRLIEKAKKLAVAHELFLQHRWLLAKEIEILLLRRQTEKLAERIASSYHQQQALMQQEAELRVYQYVDNLMRANLYRVGAPGTRKALEEINQLVHTYLKALPSVPLSKFSSYYHHLVWSVYHYYAGDKDEALEHQNKLIPLAEELFHSDADRLVDIYRNYLLLLLKVDEEALFRQHIDKLKLLEPRLEHNKYISSTAYYHLFMSLCAYKADLWRGKLLVNELRSELDELEANIQPEELNTLLLNAAVIEYMSDNYKEALWYLRQVMDKGRPGLSSDLLMHAEILHLMLHYDLDNEDILPSLVKSLTRGLEEERYKTTREAIIVRLVQELVKAELPEYKYELLLRARKDLAEVESEQESWNYLSFFDFNIWIEKQISGKSFAEIVRQEAHRRNSDIHT